MKFLFIRTLIALALVIGLADGTAAGEVSLRVMPSPETPEADFRPEDGGEWGVSAGFGRVWFESDSLSVSASMNGVAAGVVYRGVLGRRLGFSVSPVTGGAFFGEALGYKVDTYAVGSGFTFGSRVLGSADSHNLILFGGGAYSFSADRNDFSLGEYSARAHFFGFAAGAKVQIAPWPMVRFQPFYLYMGGDGWYSASVDTVLPLPDESRGALGYRDVHLLGLDFQIFGVSAKIVGDFFRDDAGSMTVVIDVLDTVRGVKRTFAGGAEGSGG
ncbi:MAG: hypothetical protein RQ801_15220, partial [Spirochaetaceae bacterium]|nr:hypothetical protein [Spirochaetaceae bacterium]